MALQHVWQVWLISLAPEVPVACHDAVPRGCWQLSGSRLQPIVAVFGPMKSGSNALCAYLRAFFDVTVTPNTVNTGYVTIPPRFRAWKHHVPCYPYDPLLLPRRSPPGSRGSEVVVLCTIRELRTNM